MTGEHERQRLVADPLARPRPVVGLEQHVEQVGRFGRMRDAVVEYVVDGGVQRQRDLLRLPEWWWQGSPRTCTTSARVDRSWQRPHEPDPASRSVRRSPRVVRSFMLCTIGPKSWLNSALATTRSVASTMTSCMSNSAPSSISAVTRSIGSIIRSTSSLRWRRANVGLRAARWAAHESPSSVSRLMPAAARMGSYSLDLTYRSRARVQYVIDVVGVGQRDETSSTAPESGDVVSACPGRGSRRRHRNRR